MLSGRVKWGEHRSADKGSDRRSREEEERGGEGGRFFLPTRSRDEKGLLKPLTGGSEMWAEDI